MSTPFTAVKSPGTRRAAGRAATFREVLDAARVLLIRDGVEGVTLRPIAKAVGLTAPALYRYFPSHEHLLRELIADLYDEVVTEMAAARDREDELPRRFLAVTRAFRSWALTHPAEFRLVFATSVAGTETDRLAEAGARFGGVFLGLFVELWNRAPFPVRPDAEVDARLIQQLNCWPPTEQSGLPIGVLEVFFGCWIRIYGLISLEVFGHLAFALDDVSPLFDTMLTELAATLGLPWREEYASG